MRIRRGLDASIAVAALVLVSRCGGDGTFGVVTPPPGPTAATLTEIQNEIFTPRCTICHSQPGPPQGLELTEGNSYRMLVGVPSTEISTFLRVAPGDASSSYIVKKLEGSPEIVGERMPFGGPYLDAAEIARVRSWIDAGALDN